MRKRNNLDEMQEQKLLKIEHNGCWLAFWGLLAAMAVQVLISGYEFSRIAGEWIVFMVLAVYLSADCARNGIWDRRLRYDARTNLIVSVIAAVVFAVFLFGVTLARFHDEAGLRTAALVGVIGGVFVFVLCFATLSLMARYVKRKQAALEAEPEDSEEE